jgi:hypothetical protein
MKFKLLQQSGIRSMPQCQNMPSTKKKWLFSQFCVQLSLRNPLHAHCHISKILNNMINSSFVDSNNWAPVSLLMNNDISTLQHFKTNSCERTACMSQVLELWFACFRSCYSFHSVSNNASLNHSTSLLIAKTFVDASPWFFLSNKEFYHSKLYWTSLTGPIV